jgi:hypothetical protein
MSMNKSAIQHLLDKEARLQNNGQGKSFERFMILQEIKAFRGDDPPPCWGEDDCSTSILVRCPWRIDCGGE